MARKLRERGFSIYSSSTQYIDDNLAKIAKRQYELNLELYNLDREIIIKSYIEKDLTPIIYEDQDISSKEILENIEEEKLSRYNNDVDS